MLWCVLWPSLSLRANYPTTNHEDNNSVVIFIPMNTPLFDISLLKGEEEEEEEEGGQRFAPFRGE